MFGNVENSLWTEAYRPSTLDGYVGNEHIVGKVKVYIESGDVPHLLLDVLGFERGGGVTLREWCIGVARDCLPCLPEGNSTAGLEKAGPSGRNGHALRRRTGQ